MLWFAKNLERQVLYQMRKIKIVTDSSSNLLELSDVAFASAPLKINTADGEEFADTKELDAEAMVAFFDQYKGKSKTSCPNTSDWLEVFAGGEDIFCVTITSGLSGSYNAANIAKADYEQEFPGRKVCVIDSLSTGGEMELIAEKLQEWIEAELSFDDICEKIKKYQKATGLLFMLESMQNLANNGRVSKIAAKAAGLLGIRVVGKASDAGTLEPLEKCRGEKKAIGALVATLTALGYEGGKVRISHCLNENAAKQLKDGILLLYPQADVKIRPTGGLCSFYAEKGGMIIGFEK